MAAAQIEPGTAWFRRCRGSRALHRGDVGQYLEEYQKTAAGFEQAGDVRNRCSARGSVGYALMELGAYAESARVLRETLDAARRIGLEHVALVCAHNLAMALARSGALAEGIALQEQAAEKARAQGDRRLEGGARLYLATTLALDGQLEAAERAAREAAEITRSMPILLPSTLATLARVLLGQGRRDEALAAAREAVSLRDAVAGVDEGESLVRLVHAEALEAAGDHEAAREAIVKAHRRLLERAARIQQAVWRESFLGNVPDNARTIALGAAWAGRA